MKTKILIIGVTGMLGNALFTQLSGRKNFIVYGTVRNKTEIKLLEERYQKNVVADIDINNTDSLIEVFGKIKPDIVLNCVGLIKQVMNENDTVNALLINALLPHRLASLCKAINARLIHFSTDCVFSGRLGNYCEADPSDAEDVYGKTKFLGELLYDHTVTLRTSIIGHGLESHVSLVDWFLGAKGKIEGYRNVIYSGLTTVEFANIVAEYVIPNDKLKGLYHVSAEPISKYDLLSLIGQIYGKKITINPSDREVSDRSLNSERFREATGYKPPTWPKLVRNMYRYYQKNKNFIQF